MIVRLSYLILLTLAFYKASAQSVYPSTTFINTSYQGKDCFANDNAANLFFNEQNHELTVVVDFKTCKVGHDSIDEWLDDLETTKLYFKGVVNTDKLLILTNGNSKTYIINGKIKLNNVVVNQSVEITFYEISKEGMLYRNTGNDYYDRIRANFQVKIDPKDFKIDLKEHHLKSKISVSVGSGFINQIKPGMETWVNDGF